MPLQAVASLRLYRQIANQIADLIDRGEYAVGARLPPERALAAMLGVSRTSVREAILALEIEGRLEVRVGTGIFVAAPSARPAGEPGSGPFELLAARVLVEGETAALAAASIGGETLAAMRGTITAMRAPGADLATRDAADREFHRLIAEASGNGALALLVATLWDQRASGLWQQIASRFDTSELVALTLADHEAIVAALAAGDPRAARAAMARHLHHVEREFKRRWDGNTTRAARCAPKLPAAASAAA